LTGSIPAALSGGVLDALEASFVVQLPPSASSLSDVAITLNLKSTNIGKLELFDIKMEHNADPFSKIEVSSDLSWQVSHRFLWCYLA
jgi:hypothetical protein